MSQTTSDNTAWILTDGRKGMENQCLGIAEAVGLPYVVKRIDPRAPWKWLPESVAGRPWPFAMKGLGKDSDRLEPPWPRLLIACGRKTVAYSIAIRRLSKGMTYTVQTQDPRIDPKFFDLVVPPKHDGLSGENVFPIVGSPTRVTRERIHDEALRFQTALAHLPRPLIAVLIGGDSRHYHLSIECVDWICHQLSNLIDEGYGIAITTSRRTGHTNEQKIRTMLEPKGAYIWDGKEPNPYFAFLGLADYLLVTEESTNMVTEAASTGKPVHTLPLEGDSPKFKRFHNQMNDLGATRPFIGTLENWEYTPVNETARVADYIRRKIGL